jgi:hypothetical protein
MAKDRREVVCVIGKQQGIARTQGKFRKLGTLKRAECIGLSACRKTQKS